MFGFGGDVQNDAEKDQKDVLGPKIQFKKRRKMFSFLIRTRSSNILFICILSKLNYQGKTDGGRESQNKSHGVKKE